MQAAAAAPALIPQSLLPPLRRMSLLLLLCHLCQHCLNSQNSQNSRWVFHRKMHPPKCPRVGAVPRPKAGQIKSVSRIRLIRACAVWACIVAAGEAIINDLSKKICKISTSTTLDCILYIVYCKTNNMAARLI